MRFYTLPPSEIPYPYVLINANSPGPGIRYITRYRGIIESIIIDSGVERLRDCRVPDYPGGYRANNHRLYALYYRVLRIAPWAEVWVVPSDYPDDYCPGRWPDNIERTVESVRHALENYPDADWAIPVQGKWMRPGSIVRSLELLREHNVPLTGRLVAIANLCVNRDCKTIAETLRLAHSWLLRHGLRHRVRVHVFGPAASCVRRAKHYIDSWDSTAWTKPRAPGGSSAWNGQERVYLFLSFIHKYSDIIEIPPLPRSMRERLRLQAGVIGDG